MDELEQQALLQRHAPIVIYDDRELFYPIAVDGYLRHSSLVVDGEVWKPPGTVEESDFRPGPPRGAYLQFVADDERRAVVKEEVARLAGKMLGPRLGRVGLFGRILDAIFQISVFLRPTTPRRTTVAAAVKTERLGLQQSLPVVYGRVVSVADWLVLHYAYFYTMNDWRTGYGGLNDHEADWEQVWVFCDPSTLRPIWVVGSNHDHHGADLRRHWDDPECRRNGERPVLFAGAGSHAFYFRPGDYVTRIEVPALRWLLRLQRWVRRVLRITDQAAERGLGPALGMPFVESATGDGRQIADWDLRPLDDDRPCFGRFSGLWGLDTGDPAGGERGPAGPKFTRDGDIRTSWADPVGFAALHGSNPPSRAPSEATLDNVRRSLAYLDQEIERTSRLLPLVQQGEPLEELSDEADRLTGLLRQRTQLLDLAKRLERGESVEPDMRAHLRKPAIPMAPPSEAGWILAAWSALSVPLLLLAVAALLVFDGFAVTTLLLLITAGFSLLEQLVRRNGHAVLRLAGLYAALGVVLVVARVVFSGVVSFSQYALGLAVSAVAVLVFVLNLGELSAVRRRAQVAEDEDHIRIARRLDGDDPDPSP